VVQPGADLTQLRRRQQPVEVLATANQVRPRRLLELAPGILLTTQLAVRERQPHAPSGKGDMESRPLRRRELLEPRLLAADPEGLRPVVLLGGAAAYRSADGERATGQPLRLVEATVEQRAHRLPDGIVPEPDR